MQVQTEGGLLFRGPPCIMSMKILIGNRTRNLPASSAVPQYGNVCKIVHVGNLIFQITSFKFIEDIFKVF